MITTATPNAALDCTYAVRDLQWDAAHRVELVHRQAGGKGVNVARALTMMEQDVCAVGIIAGTTGTWIRRDLEEAEIPHRMLEVTGESRQTVVVHDAGGRSLELNEPGMVVSAEEWAQFAALLGSQVRADDVLTLNGSLPSGVPDHAYAELVELAHGLGARVVLDCSSSALSKALEARPDVVKPNEAELAALHGGHRSSTEEVLDACSRLRSLGADAVVASRATGGVAMSSEGTWIFTHPARTGNAVGAGDVLVAGLAAGLDAGRPFPDSVRQGMLWARASLAMPFAGWVDAAEVSHQEGVLEVVEVRSDTRSREPGGGGDPISERRAVNGGDRIADLVTSTSDSSTTREHRSTRGGEFQ